MAEVRASADLLAASGTANPPRRVRNRNRPRARVIQTRILPPAPVKKLTPSDFILVDLLRKVDHRLSRAPYRLSTRSDTFLSSVHLDVFVGRSGRRTETRRSLRWLGFRGCLFQCVNSILQRLDSAIHGRRVFRCLRRQCPKQRITPATSDCGEDEHQSQWSAHSPGQF